MAKKKHQPTNISVSKHPTQSTMAGGDLGAYFIRNIPVWGNISGAIPADTWREFVRKQEIAVLCRNSLADYLNSLDWCIVSRDSEKQDEFKEDIKYYTRLFERGNAYYSEIDFSSHIEWLIKDLYDLPFGTASELGREYDLVDGKIVWIRPLDGGSLAPTLNYEFPIMQVIPSLGSPVFLQREFVSRVYLDPRTELRREGWGTAPPEKIYLALEMLNRGDFYYAQLMLNTPEAGILDLGDMDGTSAIEWVKSMRDTLYGINPLKIPVLYEHTSEAKWIPFGKLPSEISYDNITGRYIAIVCAGYGITPSDIGLSSSRSNGGETLAGTIREERKSLRSGKAVAKKKTKGYFDKILPEDLQFKWIDYDDERNVSMSRARMASANAFNLFIQDRIFTPGELRRQSIADGLITITVPEKVDMNSDEWPAPPAMGAFGNKLTNQIGSPKAPSGGGQGNITAQQTIQKSRPQIEASLSKAIFAGNRILGALLSSVHEKNDFPAWEQNFDDFLLNKSQVDEITNSVITDTKDEIIGIIQNQPWFPQMVDEITKSATRFEESTLQQTFRQSKQAIAEDEFIQGLREDALLTEQEELEIDTFRLDKSIPQLNEFVQNALSNSMASLCILCSKNKLVEFSYSLDTKDSMENNNIKVAREIASQVTQLLPKMTNELISEAHQFIKNNL